MGAPKVRKIQSKLHPSFYERRICSKRFPEEDSNLGRFSRPGKGFSRFLCTPKK
jgi:hypothetical protein